MTNGFDNLEINRKGNNEKHEIVTVLEKKETSRSRQDHPRSRYTHKDERFGVECTKNELS